MTVFITHFLKSTALDAVIRCLGILCITLARLWRADREGPQGVFLQPIAQLLARKATQWTARARAITDRRELCRGFLTILGLCFLMAHSVQSASAAELSQLKVERTDDGVYLSALVEFDLPPVVEDALIKGIPMFFVVEADIYQNRWYWTDRRVASATRTIRLAFQPLTRRWRVNIVTGFSNNSAGLRATLNQNYDTLPEALSAVQRLSRWRIADNLDVEPDAVHKLVQRLLRWRIANNAEVDPDVVHKFEFSFRLDLSQLPRPFQIGVAGQKDWNIAVQTRERLQIVAAKGISQTDDKAKAVVPPVKEADK